MNIEHNFIPTKNLGGCINLDTTYWESNRERRGALFKIIFQICSNKDSIDISFSQYYKSCVKILTEGLTEEDSNIEMMVPTEQSFTRNIKKSKTTTSNYQFNGHTKNGKVRNITSKFYNAMAIRAIEIWRANQALDCFDQSPLRDFLDKAKSELISPNTETAGAIYYAITGRNFNPNNDPERMATKKLFGDNLQKSISDTLQFETYRFSTRAGYIEKSFTVIISPNYPDTSYCRFVNFFLTDRDHTSETNSSVDASFNRRIDGTVLGFNSGVYLIGPDTTNDFLKIIVLKGDLQDEKLICGATLTTNHLENLVLGKVILKPTTIIHTEKLIKMGRKPLGLHSLSGLANELGPADIKAMRNTSEMHIEDTLKKWNGNEYEVTNQQVMVGEVEQILRKSSDGKSTFVLEKNNRDDDFNPADNKNYTYNGAIEI